VPLKQIPTLQESPRTPDTEALEYADQALRIARRLSEVDRVLSAILRDGK
jgi:hypothetical protein